MLQTPALKELQRIPGVGPSIAEDLYGLGIHSVADLHDQDAQTLYDRLCRQQGQKIDRCILYVFRCAIYFADHEAADTLPEPEKLQWWNWKDAK